MDRPAKRPTTRGGSSKKVESTKKRKAEEELSGDQPLKVAKTGKRDVTVAVEKTSGVSKCFRLWKIDVDLLCYTMLH